MMQALVIALREGLEAFLIVAITLAYLRQTNRHPLTTAVYWGTGAGVVASSIAGYFFGKAESQPFWEGTLAAIAAVLVISMVVYMLSAAKHMRANIAARIEAASLKSGTGAWIGVFAFVLLMITREGMETALMLSAVLFSSGMEDLAIGCILGVLLAALVAWGWGRFGSRIRLDRFFKVTSVFLVLFALQLVFYAFHEYTETGLLPIDNDYWHVVTEPWGPEGQYGQWITYSLVVVPLLWFVALVVRDKLSQPTRHAPSAQV
ncbi:high-affinity iron transporter [Oryzomicrobium terrae]|uniref:High-affinity iron transporter n=1 Tax=Oryzomicrobium terrae TaxID=1735038 RepID=A0A5C1E5V4_9RHOO|nr:FTR1 family protein [Oryzomicrobium terrae]QEL64312.1 high-affinity iron transporter [Oryzomicrobium terrae]